MATSGSGKVNEEIRIDRNSHSRTRSRFRDPDSKHKCDDEYKERRHRDKPSHKRTPPSRTSSSPSSSSSLDSSRQASECRPRPNPSSVIYHAKSRKRSRIRSYSSHDRSRSDKRGRRDNQKQGSKTGERNASGDVTNMAFKVRNMEGFLEQIATHMGLSDHVSLDTQPGPGGEPQRPGPILGPHHNGALPKRIMDHGRRRDDEVSLMASAEGIPDPPQVGHDLSQVCFNPVPDVTPKWSPHEVIPSYVSKYFGLRSLRIMEHQILITLYYLKLIKQF